MGFGTGLVAGLASGFEKVVERNQDSIRDSMSRAEKYMYERYSQEQAAEREKIEKAEEAVKRLAKYVDVENLPEGVRAEDVASAWFVKSGGSISEAEKMADRLSDAASYMGDEAAKLTFAKARNTGMTVREMVKSTIRPPDLDYIRGPQKTMRGLFGEVDITAEALKRAGVPTDVQTRTAFDTEGFEGLGTKGKFYDVTEYKTKREKDELAIQQAKITLQKSQKEIAEMGGLDETAGRYYLKDTLKNALGKEKIGWDEVNDVVDFKDSKENVQGMYKGTSNAIEAASKYFLSTGTVNKTSGKNQLIGFASSNAPFIKPVGAGVDAKGNPLETNEVGKVYAYSVGGKDRSGIWLGNDMGFLTIPGL